MDKLSTIILPDPAIISKLPYLNIDLYNAARPTRFFVFSVSSGMSRLATSFSWKIPNIAKIPTADSYVIRVWAPYSDRSRGDYW